MSSQNTLPPAIILAFQDLFDKFPQSSADIESHVERVFDAVVDYMRDQLIERLKQIELEKAQSTIIDMLDAVADLIREFAIMQKMKRSEADLYLDLSNAYMKYYQSAKDIPAIDASFPVLCLDLSNAYMRHYQCLTTDDPDIDGAVDPETLSAEQSASANYRTSTEEVSAQPQVPLPLPRARAVLRAMGRKLSIVSFLEKKKVDYGQRSCIPDSWLIFPINAFSLSRDTNRKKNAITLWNEFLVGTESRPSVAYMEETYGNQWRKSTTERTYFERRKTLIQLLAYSFIDDFLPQCPKLGMDPCIDQFFKCVDSFQENLKPPTLSTMVNLTGKWKARKVHVNFMSYEETIAAFNKSFEGERVNQD